MVGLSPKKYYVEKYPDSKSILVNEMKNGGVIDEAVFSVKLGRVIRESTESIRETPSTIQFGGWSE